MKFNKIVLSVALAGVIGSFHADAIGSTVSDNEKSFLFFGKKKKKSSMKDGEGTESSASAKTLTKNPHRHGHRRAEACLE